MPTSDSGVIGGAYGLFKLNKDGLVQWRNDSVTSGVYYNLIKPSRDGYFFGLNSEGDDPVAAEAFGVTKFDGNGHLLWDREFGGSRNEYPYDLLATPDGGCIVVGSTKSNDGDVVPSANHVYDFLYADCWIIKINAAGQKVWQKTLGGSQNDKAVRILDNGTGGCVIGCQVESSDGDFPGTEYSTWILNLDANGNEIWRRHYDIGGWFEDMVTASNGNIALLGYGYDTPGNHGYIDVWMAMVDFNGVLKWQKSLGGSEQDACTNKKIQVAENGSCIVAATTYSNDGDVTHNNGSEDVWLFKIDGSGNLVWQKTFGASRQEEADVRIQNNNDLLLLVSTRSSDGIFSAGYNQPNDSLDKDLWLFKLRPNGDVQWKKLLGSNGDDFGYMDFLYDNEIYIYGFSTTLDSITSSYNYTDHFWLSKVGPANIIKATAFIDKNSNGIKEADEKFSTGVKITAVKNRDTVLGNYLSSGTFLMDVDTGSYTVNISPLTYYSALPVSRTSTFNSYFNTDSVSFALQPIPNKQDLTIRLVPLTVARPGFNVSYRLLYQNTGTTTIPSGQIVFKKDSRLNFASADPMPASANSDSLSWNYTNLQPGEEASISLKFTVAAPPAANISDTLASLAYINPVTSDQTPANDTALLKQVVQGSFDPNDKTENNGGVVKPAFISKGTPLQYIVRFQNTGSDTAFNVTVRDTLSNRVEASSIQTIAASHPYTLSVDNNSVLTWHFNNILLPDQTTNEPASHGYVVYTVKPKADVVAGETIHNTAAIYFDYNLPVLTNDAPTTVTANFGVLPQGLLRFYGNRQNASVSLFWKTALEAGAQRFEIERSANGTSFETAGSVAAQNGVQDYAFADNTTGTSAPVLFYRLKMILENGGRRYSDVLLFKQRGAATGLEIYPNPVRQQGFVAFETSRACVAELQLTNAAGKLLSRETLPVQPGRNVVPLTRTPAMPAGIYVVRLIANGEVKSAVFAVY